VVTRRGKPMIRLSPAAPLRSDRLIGA
jgi:antitoxin (DNA-binding transcriptional repressor) of toxin-antitoxin stability system